MAELVIFGIICGFFGLAAVIDIITTPRPRR